MKNIFVITAVLLAICIPLLVVSVVINDTTLFQATIIGYLLVSVLLTIKTFKL